MLRERAQYWLLQATLFLANKLFPYCYMYCPNHGDIVTGLVFATNKFHLEQFARVELLENAEQEDTP